MFRLYYKATEIGALRVILAVRHMISIWHNIKYINFWSVRLYAILLFVVYISQGPLYINARQPSDLNCIETVPNFRRTFKQYRGSCWVQMNNTSPYQVGIVQSLPENNTNRVCSDNINIISGILVFVFALRDRRIAIGARPNYICSALEW